ncbi:MAG: four helix bundle protein [Candidatus Omnitrophica bacterium]|nr:four helix bundle protein [Candidatus Omnitrophota bacterium]
MEEKIKSFKDLRIWKKGIEIVEDSYRITKAFPKEEIYGLTSQIRRASVSVPSNIAEGFKRYHNKEYRQFLFIALGSLAELETQLIVAEKLKYVSFEDLKNVFEKMNYLGKMISSLLKKLV